MEDIEQDFNFNTPLELTEVFRVPGSTGVMEEWAAKVLVGWEDVRMIEQYAYPDDWQTYKGEKFYITLASGQPKLIFGSYQEFKRYWTALREKYETFRTNPE